MLGWVYFFLPVCGQIKWSIEFVRCARGGGEAAVFGIETGFCEVYYINYIHRPGTLLPTYNAAKTRTNVINVPAAIWAINDGNVGDGLLIKYKNLITSSRIKRADTDRTSHLYAFALLSVPALLVSSRPHVVVVVVVDVDVVYTIS